MKTIKYIPLLALFCMVFTRCETDIEKMYVKSTNEVTPPVLKSEGFTDITIDESNINLVPMVLSWSKSDFGPDVLVEYSLEMADNASFSDAHTLTIGNNVYLKALSCTDLSKWAINYFNGLGANDLPVKVSIIMRIVATVALENPTVTIPPAKVYSNTVSVSVVPYNVPGSYPETMYMIGSDFGGWNWGSDQVAVMTPVHSFDGHFWCVRYITAGNGFKWCSKREWNGDFFSLGEDLGFYTADGNAFVEEDGMYMVYMDMTTGKISVEPAKVYGMGDCFGGWNTATYPFVTEGKTMVATTIAAGELRIYAASDIAPVGNDWWKMEFVPMDGVIVYRGAGNDQERIPVPADKKVVLDFNAETGIIE
ncbi:MAG: SusF/SusE family outer membrane protein [Bacteroidetes bacterium]|nr:SusF/SusE family outer membrane protein [Bacteroidota bacterium]